MLLSKSRLYIRDIFNFSEKTEFKFETSCKENYKKLVIFLGKNLEIFECIVTSLFQGNLEMTEYYTSQENWTDVEDKEDYWRCIHGNIYWSNCPEAIDYAISRTGEYTYVGNALRGTSSIIPIFLYHNTEKGFLHEMIQVAIKDDNNIIARIAVTLSALDSKLYGVVRDYPELYRIFLKRCEKERVDLIELKNEYEAVNELYNQIMSNARYEEFDEYVYVAE